MPCCVNLDEMRKMQQQFFQEIAVQRTIEPIYRTSGSGSSKPTSSGSGSANLCEIGDGTPVDASELCNTLAKIEGNGTYTQKNGNSSASGRYQFVRSTAVGVIKNIGAASSTAEAHALWNKCHSSNSIECKKLQDKMCNYYSQKIVRQLKAKGIPITARNVYLAWNQGAGGASLILQAAQSGTPINLKGMHGQAWAYSPDANVFLRNMEKYMKERGVQP